MVFLKNWIFFSIFVATTPLTIPPINVGSLANQTESTKQIDSTTAATTSTTTLQNQDITLGPCTWAIGRTCPDTDISYYLYTRQNPQDSQCIHIDDSLRTSNLSQSFYDNRYPSKIIIHGYNANMFLHSLSLLKNEYLAKGNYNIFYIDWSKLALGPCYINAVYNIQHTGACVAQLVKRIRDMGSSDIHIIGFSLGAHIANYIARNLENFRLPRITGLDPALPLFITSDNNEKLDKSDADYVDIIHTNALVQGKFERCGHADFYMNGGVFQPNCFEDNPINPFPCFHHRAIDYFLESIRSVNGFWGWPCSSYFAYLTGMCPPTNNLVEVGSNVKTTTLGMFFVETKGKPPYAMGKWTNTTKFESSKPSNIMNDEDSTSLREPPSKRVDPLLGYHNAQWEKLNYSFNNHHKQQPLAYSQDYFGNIRTYLSEDSKGDVPQEALKTNDKPSPKSLWQEFKRNLSKSFMASSTN